jgi:hypothetical protein
MFAILLLHKCSYVKSTVSARDAVVKEGPAGHGSAFLWLPRLSLAVDFKFSRLSRCLRQPDLFTMTEPDLNDLRVRRNSYEVKITSLVIFSEESSIIDQHVGNYHRKPAALRDVLTSSD